MLVGGALLPGVGEVEHQAGVLPRGAWARAADVGRDGGAHRRLAVQARQVVLVLVLVVLVDLVDLERLAARGDGVLLVLFEGDLLLGPAAAPSFAALGVRDLLVLRVEVDEPTGHPVRFGLPGVCATDALTGYETGHGALLE